MQLEQIDEAGRVRTLRATDAQGAATTVHVAAWPRDAFGVSLHLVQPQQRVLDWCRERGDVAGAMNGGFFTKPAHQPLGELHLHGARRTTRPFRDPWSTHRGAIHVDGDGAHIGPWHEVAGRSLHGPASHALQAGPILVHGGAATVAAHDPEGFASTHAHEFDSDITAERLPRMAFGIGPQELLSVAVDGRGDDDTGLLLPELAEVLVLLGADAAINLDGGTSSSLVVDGVLHNHPRDDEGEEFLRGYPTPTIIAFTGR